MTDLNPLRKVGVANWARPIRRDYNWAWGQECASQTGQLDAYNNNLNHFGTFFFKEFFLHFLTIYNNNLHMIIIKIIIIYHYP